MARSTSNDTGFTYWALAPKVNRVKIGFSATYPDTRLQEIQTGCPEKLIRIGFYPGDISFEKEMHLMFASFRVHGEWFDYTEPLKDFAAKYLRPWPTPQRAINMRAVKVKLVRIHTPPEPSSGSKMWTRQGVFPKPF